MIMEFDDIVEILEGKFLSNEELEEIMESEHVIYTEHNGLSGAHYGYIWHTVILNDDTEYDVYTC